MKRIDSPASSLALQCSALVAGVGSNTGGFMVHTLEVSFRIPDILAFAVLCPSDARVEHVETQSTSVLSLSGSSSWLEPYPTQVRVLLQDTCLVLQNTVMS
jgi:hypothetical protein